MSKEAFAALAEVVGEEIADTNDEPLTPKQARYVAAALIVGMQNRGWEWRQFRTVVNVVNGLAPSAATVDQVAAFLESHRPDTFT